MKIEKKVQPPYFEAILKGDKNFEVRLNDFECNEGDVLSGIQRKKITQAELLRRK